MREKLLHERLADNIFLYGGFTIGIDDIPVPSEGYFVGKKSLSVLDDYATKDQITSYIEEVRTLNEASPTQNFFLGAWLDKESQKIYYDISEHFTLREKAIVEATRRGELAVWDIARSEEIRLETM